MATDQPIRDENASAGGSIDFLGLDYEELNSHLVSSGALALGARLSEQAFRGVHQGLAFDFREINGLGRHKAAALDGLFSIAQPIVLEAVPSWDQSVRYAFRLVDGSVIETVLIPHHGLWTACVSSQAGCALACQFCATGRLGLKRNLRASEIVAQVLMVQKLSGRRVSDLVFMGMGEPLQNEAAVFKACRILSMNRGAQISPRRMVISTAGVVPAIRRFAAMGSRMKLAISLGSAVPEKRGRLMPIQATYGFEDLMDAIREYSRAIGGRHVTLEYIAIRGLTLGDDDIEAIQRNLVGFKFILNLIPLNPVDPSLEAPTHEEVRAFTKKLRPLGFPVKIRRSSGRDLAAGCGQLGTSILRGGSFDIGRSIVEPTEAAR